MNQQTVNTRDSKSPHELAEMLQRLKSEERLKVEGVIVGMELAHRTCDSAPARGQG